MGTLGCHPPRSITSPLCKTATMDPIATHVGDTSLGNICRVAVVAAGCAIGDRSGLGETAVRATAVTRAARRRSTTHVSDGALPGPAAGVRAAAAPRGARGRIQCRRYAPPLTDGRAEQRRRRAPRVSRGARRDVELRAQRSPATGMRPVGASSAACCWVESSLYSCTGYWLVPSRSSRMASWAAGGSVCMISRTRA